MNVVSLIYVTWVRSSHGENIFLMVNQYGKGLIKHCVQMTGCNSLEQQRYFI